MYTAIFLILFGLGVVLIVLGVNNDQRGKKWVGGLLTAFVLGLYWYMDFWAEYLWFDAVGYADRFWVVELTRIGFVVAGGIIGFLIIFLLTLKLSAQRQIVKWGARLVGMITGALWAIGNWETILKFFNKVSTSLHDPIIGQDTGFYLFSYPFYSSVQGMLVFLFLVGIIAQITAIFSVKNFGNKITFASPEFYELYDPRFYRPIFINLTLLLLAMAWGKWLARYDLMYSEWGAVSGPGWTDVNIRLPAYNFIAVLTLLTPIAFFIPAIRNFFNRIIRKIGITANPSLLLTSGSVIFTLFIVWFIVLTGIPGIFQWLRVEPNEITFEKPYISNNIEFTKYGFKLDKVEEKEFPASETISANIVQENRKIFENVRLWDYRALDAVYEQFQEIRLYYEFADVDIDRYHYDGQINQVMVSARELEQSNLPAQSQTFVNQRFKYTHGYGITMANVNDFTSQGLPNLLIRDIPPVSQYDELEVEEPRIYYGELSDTHVIVNTDEEEFDYPSGDENVYIRYDGIGGVQLSNLWRKFLYGYKFDGTKFFVSGYPNENSRIMFNREIKSRVQTLAPFLAYDDDPYITLADGRLYWIIDAYTVSRYFPYSEPFYNQEIISYSSGENNYFRTFGGSRFQGINYIRNSVKVVVDAYNGSVDFYIYDEEDPLIQVWAKVFDDFFKSKEEMPAAIREHVRYPADFLLVQGLVYAKYHMEDPTVFYNQEDLWIRATEKYYSQVQPVEPYYIMWEPQDSDELQFIVMLPFTPKNRQVMIGWIAGMSDPENYGRFLAYQFPKEKRVLGPQQVETKIDQDSFLSGQLTLWDQRGSNVIRGNVLAIPIDETLLYIEPIYLQAETAAYPELRLVCVMHNDKLSYAETFTEALQGIFENEISLEPSVEMPIMDQGTQAPQVMDMDSEIRSANQAFDDYLRHTGENQFDEAARSLKELQNSLQQLLEKSQSPAADTARSE